MKYQLLPVYKANTHSGIVCHDFIIGNFEIHWHTGTHDDFKKTISWNKYFRLRRIGYGNFTFPFPYYSV